MTRTTTWRARDRGPGAGVQGGPRARRPATRRGRRGSPRSRCRSPLRAARYATAPMPANASPASDTCPAHPMRGTSDIATSAVHIASANWLRFVGERNALTTTITRNNTPMPSTVSRTVEIRSVRRTTLSRANWSLACGSSSNTTSSITVGIAAGAVAHRPPNCRNVCDHSIARARISAPRYVSGRLRIRPTAAAANDVMISNVSGPLVDMPASGARRMPASAAREQPSAHEKLDTSSERAPTRLARPRLSTTARIDTPRRVRNSNRRKPMASTIASTTVRRRAHVTTMPATRKPPSPNRVGSVWLRFWSQIMLARPMNANMRPTVTMSWTTSSLPCRWRIMARSRPMPISGAITRTVSGIAITCGTP